MHTWGLGVRERKVLSMGVKQRKSVCFDGKYLVPSSAPIHIFKVLSNQEKSICLSSISTQQCFAARGKGSS